VVTSRRPRRIKETLLRKQHKRLFCSGSIPCRSLTNANVPGRATKVQCCCASALRIDPGYRLAQCPINFENAWAVFEPAKTLKVTMWDAIGGNLRYLLWREVEEHRPSTRQTLDRIDARIAFNHTA
jgi:hypothetical protein